MSSDLREVTFATLGRYRRKLSMDGTRKPATSLGAASLESRLDDWRGKPRFSRLDQRFRKRNENCGPTDNSRGRVDGDVPRYTADLLLAQEWTAFGIREAGFTFEVPPGFSLDHLANDGQDAAFYGSRRSKSCRSRATTYSRKLQNECRDADGSGPERRVECHLS